MAAAPAALAIPSDGCDSINGASGTGNVAFAATYSYQADEVLTVTWSQLTTPDTMISLEVPERTVVGSRIGAGSLSYTFLSDTDTTWASRLASGIGYLVVSCGYVELPTADAPPAPPIPAWVQAHGRDKDATCLDGWDASWQSWAEPVTGGWVCTRSVPSLG